MSSKEDGELYQPPKPPLPVPMSYTKPRPPVHSRSNSLSQPDDQTRVAIPLPGLVSGPPPPYTSIQPLAQSRYRPFLPQYQAPPSRYEAPTKNTDKGRFGTTTSISCPNSLSLEGLVSIPRTSASGLGEGSVVPDSGSLSIPRDSPDSDENGQEFKTRSLPTRCLHGSGPGKFDVSESIKEPLHEIEEDLYGSSEDMSSGPSILEKLMVWAYYNTNEEDQEGELFH